MMSDSALLRAYTSGWPVPNLGNDAANHIAGLRAVEAAVAEKALTDAAKSALNDWSEGRTRGRLWHEWLIHRAVAFRVPAVPGEEQNR